jgi:hypothetical protein
MHLKLFIVVSYLIFSFLNSGCGTSQQVPSSGTSTTQPASTDRPTASTAPAWTRVISLTAGDDPIPGACAEDAQFQVDNSGFWQFKQCVHQAQGQVASEDLAKLATLVNAVINGGFESHCSGSPMSGKEHLTLQLAEGRSILIRKWDSESDCYQGSETAIEELKLFIADLESRYATSTLQ